MRKNNLSWRVNQQIQASKIRVIGSDGKQVGLMSLSDALARSLKEGLDLVEIAPNAKPPVCKIVSLGKFLYQEEKRQKRDRKKARVSEIKEVRLSPFIAEHDFNNRLEKIREFLDDNNKVRVVVKFKGRQLGSKKFGYQILDKVRASFEGKITVDMEPKFIGRHLTEVISPISKGKKIEKTTVSKVKKEGVD